MKYYFHRLRLLSVIVLWCAGCNNNDLNTPGNANQVADKTVLLATIIDEVKSQTVDPSLSMGLHIPQATSLQPVFSKYGGGVAYSAEKNDKAYVVHNERAGKLYDAVGAIALSSDGRRIAYGALAGGNWHMVIDGKEGAAFSTVKSPLSAQMATIWHIRRCQGKNGI